MFIDTFVERRLEWELENGWVHKTLFLIGLLLLPVAFVGVLPMVLADKWKNKNIEGIRRAVADSLLSLQEQRESPEIDEPF